MARAALIHTNDFGRFSYPDHSPFKTHRAARTCAILDGLGMLPGPGNRLVEPVPATRAEVEVLHHPRYLDAILAAERGEFTFDALGMGLGSEDCPVFPGMYEYAMLAVGATLTGVKLLLSGEARVAFNPSGGYHHAGPDYAAGFCYVNDVALACHHLAAAGKRVLYLDLDVHHGDGVQNAFYERSDVFTMSLHESGKTLFPGTGFEDEIGAGEGRGCCLNVPLPVGTYDEAYQAVFVDLVMPLLRAWRPDVLVVELGMDALQGDPLAHLNLTNNTYVRILELLLALDLPILATGGGGYHVDNTARGWALCWSVLSGQDDPYPDLAFGLGGVMLQSTEWRGGLRDRVLLTHGGQRRGVDEAIAEVAGRIRSTLFPLHGL